VNRHIQAILIYWIRSKSDSPALGGSLEPE